MFAYRTCVDFIIAYFYSLRKYNVKFYQMTSKKEGFIWGYFLLMAFPVRTHFISGLVPGLQTLIPHLLGPVGSFLMI
jgi:hypothetical protein